MLKEKVENPQTKFLKQVIESIHTHLDDTNFGPTQLAKEIGLSESQIYRKLKAKELIETTDKTISEIAYQVGFNDPSWFSRAFKKEFNLAPSDIHKQLIKRILQFNFTSPCNNSTRLLFPIKNYS